jgi:hypothetical protein
MNHPRNPERSIALHIRATRDPARNFPNGYLEAAVKNRSFATFGVPRGAESSIASAERRKNE